MMLTIVIAFVVAAMCQGSLSLRSAMALHYKKNNITKGVGLLGLPLKRFWISLFQTIAAVLIIISAWLIGQWPIVALGVLFLLPALMVLLVSTPSSPD